MADDYKARWPEMDVEYLILETDEFIVCLDSELDVDWGTNAKYMDPTGECEKLHHAILNRMALLESIPTHDLNRKIRISYKRMLGEAIARSLSRDYDNASKILDSAESFVQVRNEELARSWYLSTSGITTAFILLMGLILWLNRESARAVVGNLAFILILSAIAGAVGALMSVIMRMGHTNLDSSAGKWLHQLESVSRIILGMISAVIVALGVHTEIILPIFAKMGKPTAVMVLSGLIAGASERLAPSLIQGVEGKESQKSKGKSKKIE